jgi:hypothetical protein
MVNKKNKAKCQLQRDWIRDIASKTKSRGIVFLTSLVDSIFGHVTPFWPITLRVSELRRNKLFYRTKDKSLRQTTYFEPSIVQIGTCVRALQVRKNKVRKGRIFTHLWGRMGWSDHYQILHTCSCKFQRFSVLIFQGT